jgi:AcrR family transcriptional regulator
MAIADTKRYHHGELRDALLTAALAMLEREGPAALSLRALARAVGVSAMAPYHHFADREALLAAVAIAGFERLQQQKAENEAAHVSARDALVAGAANYVRFILDNPNLYRLMKGPEFSSSKRHPELSEAAAAPGRTLVKLIARLLDENDVRGPTEQYALALWGLAHGVGTLALDGQLSPSSAHAIAQDGAAALIQGWLTT